MNYSQTNEQNIILEYFKDKPKGTFLDIGANDGETYSNTRALALNGWNGVCIEPGESAFKKLSQLYKESQKVLCFNYAISQRDETLLFYESGTIFGNDIGLLSSAIYGETLKWNHETKFQKSTVIGVSWDNFTTNICKSTFDFISIDAEGMDLEILFQMNLTGLKCKLICIEYGEDQAKRNAIYNYVSKFGMKLIDYNSTNIFYGM